MGISIVIPVYNEGENIKATIAEIEKKIKCPYAISIVYDREEDNTIPVVKELMSANKPITLLKNKYGRGALNAIKTGFETVNAEAILVVMADLSDDLSNVDEMLEKLNQGNAVVCGSRYVRGGRQLGGPLFKKTLSRLAGVSLYYLARIPTHDVTNSYKLYRKSLLNEIVIESNGGFELGMEIVIKAFIKGYGVAEVPSTWTDRSAGESRFRLWKWLPSYLHWYFYALKGKWLGTK